ncbi:MAG: hypothetical protein PHO37_02890 [Kiritimatiellae bacterium]|nr:hypothetical protein [Kiritimatiellia bacterium]
MLKFIITVLIICVARQISYCQNLSEIDYDYACDYCKRIIKRIGLNETIFNGILQELSPQTVYIEKKFNLRAETLKIHTSRLFMRINHKTKSLQVVNCKLDDFVKKDPMKIPGLSITEAIDKAMFYINKLDVDLPKEMSLKKVQFDKDYPHCWEVRWGPSYGGYDYDDFVAPYEQSIMVVFHETIGFCIYACGNDFPAPISTVTKVSKEDAVRRAEKAAPMVMKTPYYKMARVPGFKVSGLDKAELLIAAPNWLLDPSRAQWIRQEVPEESRLCWVITLLTVDTVKREDGMLPIPPKIVVYIDAATGEIVGANFT